MASPKEAADRHVAAFNAHDVEAHKANEAPDVEWIMPGGVSLRGPEQVADLQRLYWAALPDVKVTPTNQLVSGSAVVTEGYFAGTPPQGDIPPSAKLRYATVQRVENGLIVSEHLYFDMLEFLSQLGALPAPAH